MSARDFSGIRTDSELPDPFQVRPPENVSAFLDEFVCSTASKLNELERLALNGESPANDQEHVATARRILHNIKGDAGILGIDDINEFCHQAEFALEELADHARTDMLLRARDWLTAATTHLAHPTTAPASDPVETPAKSPVETPVRTDVQTADITQSPARNKKTIKCLIVEDDFTSRKLLQIYLTGHADCDIAVNGREATEVIRQSLANHEPYDLLCLDINMPEMNGQEALKIIRQIEKEHGIEGLDSVKAIMTTSMDDRKNIMDAFRSGCEAYIPKPVQKAALLEQLVKLELIEKGINRHESTDC